MFLNSAALSLTRAGYGLIIKILHILNQWLNGKAIYITGVFMSFITSNKQLLA